jgi:mono/diheme cytochrome c family protein
MRRIHRPVLRLFGWFVAAFASALLPPALSADDSSTATETAVDFARDVRPLLEARCWDCHGPDTREAGLRLDRRRPALLGGDSGQVIKPHDADGSPLIQRVTSEDDAEAMPPGDRLSADEVAILTKWISAGAPWPEGIDGPAEVPEHWAYQPIVRAEPPVSASGSLILTSSGTLSPIDAFVLKRLENEGITPSPEADRYTLIKRLSYDLLGLPPEPAAVDAFVNDTSDDAYEKLVDGLLASPHFGERWGRHWLDQARYADSDGYEKDRPRYNAWKYRDWVIDAINNDMPFDQFTIEQLAGDLLPEPTQQQLLATAFNRQTLTNTEGGTDQEQWRVEAIFDRVETLGTAWLGLTVGCARCHSHKYDDISQREYYQLFAFFNNGDEVTQKMPTSHQALAKYREQKKGHAAKLAELRKPLQAARDAIRPGFAEWEQTQRQRLTEANESPATFYPLHITSVVSEQGATVEPQEDGSWLVTGKRPTQDVTVITAALDQPLSGLRLEVLADESLPAGGPGRADNGNLVLSEITAHLMSPNAENSLRFAAAKADFSQGSYPVVNAIDGVEDSGGWALGGAIGKDHSAVFAFEEPLGVPEEEGAASTLVVRLSQQYDRSPHTIGRFRLSGMTGTDPELLGLPENVRTLLAIAPGERNEKQQAELFDYYASLDPQVQKLQAAVDKHLQGAPFNPEMAIDILKERTDDRRQTHVMKRGDFLQPLGEVEPATFEVLHRLDVRSEQAGGDRLDLATWLVSSDNPLTPRVAVNHVWSHLFGRGLVKTVGDFGVRGEPPTHPHLLDWLASEFINLGWSRKHLIKTIVMSHTYRRSSAHRSELADIDPENRLLYRQNRFRVEAEIVRDLSLAASGLLDRRLGGPSVFPPLPPGIAELSYAGNFKWGNSDWNSRPDRPHQTPPKDDVHRRGLYTFFKRTAAHPNLVTFDCPDANTTCVERRTSNTPLQALTTLNNEIYVETARALARRVLVEVDTNDAERMNHAFRLCAVRSPSNGELESLLDLLNDARRHYAEHPRQAEVFGGAEHRAELSPADAAAWATTARILMNLDEFVTRE